MQPILPIQDKDKKKGGGVAGGSTKAHMSETGWVFLGMDSEKPKMRAESPGDVRPHNK